MPTKFWLGSGGIHNIIFDLILSGHFLNSIEAFYFLNEILFCLLLFIKDWSSKEYLKVIILILKYILLSLMLKLNKMIFATSIDKKLSITDFWLRQELIAVVIW